MHPTWMLVMLVGLCAAFAWSANRRWQLLKVGQPTERLDQIGRRIMDTLIYAFGQRKMPYYPAAGLAHAVIFFGFLTLLLRSVILWGRGFVPEFNFWILGPAPVAGLPLGHLYDFVKDIAAVAVLLACLVFVYFRVVVKDKRMTLSGEALLILGIIITMMLADMMYDGASEVLYRQHALKVCQAGTEPLCSRVSTIVAHLGPQAPAATAVAWEPFPTPAGSLWAVLLQGSSPATLVVVAHVGYWVHSGLVLIFMNVLPYTKHFHVITSIPNVFLHDLAPAASIPLVGKSSEEIGEKVMKAFDAPDTAPPIGYSRIEHFHWKHLLDFYSCTECGRCTEHCPANRTDKVLSPKMFSIDLRNHLYGREAEFLNRPGGAAGLPPAAKDEAHGDKPAAPAEGAEEKPEQAEGTSGADEHAEAKEHEGSDEHGHGDEQPDNPEPDKLVEYKPVDLVPEVIKPEVLWGCTTCRACEEQCPVLLSYVDKIVGMRQNLVLIKAEFPPELQGPFQGMETNGNPWNLSPLDRDAWAADLDVPRAADKPDAEVLFWVGCAASFDDRAKKIARSMAKLLQAAGVDFCILGQEEKCTGDIARRTGNEYLFCMLAEQNIAILNGYKDKGGVKTIVTACPHCYSTLKHDYQAFGGNYNVVHHSELLLELVRQGKLKPRERVEGEVVFHDSCYLGRYNGIYEAPRDLLLQIPGLALLEAAEDARRHKGVCCGAGGGQMFMEEQNKNRMNVRRTKQLLETGAKTIASGCPFCVTMLTDGLKDQNKEEAIRQLDIAELLEQSCALDKKVEKKSPKKTAKKTEDTQDSA
jgi:Fe-S oxidoreductase